MLIKLVALLFVAVVIFLLVFAVRELWRLLVELYGLSIELYKMWKG